MVAAHRYEVGPEAALAHKVCELLHGVGVVEEGVMFVPLVYLSSP